MTNADRLQYLEMTVEVLKKKLSELESDHYVHQQFLHGFEYAIQIIEEIILDKDSIEVVLLPKDTSLDL